MIQCYNKLQKFDVNGVIYIEMVFDQPVIKIGKKAPLKQNKRRSAINNKNDNEKRAIRKARTNITDYVKTNTDLKYFVTYTLDSSKIDRYDEDKIYKKIRNWLSNRVKLKGLKYLLVPERHKDGAWHFHGFVNKPLEWKYGFSKVDEIDREKGLDKIINYTISYLKKDMIKFKGRRYLHSQNLSKPGKIYSNSNFDDEPGDIIELDEIRVRMKMQKRLSGRTPSLPPLAPVPPNPALQPPLRLRL